MNIQFKLFIFEMERLNEILTTDLIKEIESNKALEYLRYIKDEVVYAIEWEWVQEENLVIIHTVYKFD